MFLRAMRNRYQNDAIDCQYGYLLPMKNFNSYTNRLDMNLFRSLCEREGWLRNFKKGELLTKQDHPLKYWGYVLKGYFKYSVIDARGNTYITGFSFPENLVGDFLSIVGGISKTNIIAATDTKILMCETTALKHLFNHNSTLRNAMAEGLFNQAYTQYLDLYRLTPKERYIALLQRCPNILQNISLKEMASYLQITPTHLSRIRKELTFA